MDVRVFLSERMKKSCPPELLQKLVSDFKEYKTTGVLPSDFGRDVPYEFPFTVRESGLQHVHIRDSSSKRWKLQKLSFYKTSDTALIYCQGDIHKHCYLMIAFLENAHQTYRAMPLYLTELAEVAEAFRTKF